MPLPFSAAQPDAAARSLPCLASTVRRFAAGASAAGAAAQPRSVPAPLQAALQGARTLQSVMRSAVLHLTQQTLLQRVCLAKLGPCSCASAMQVPSLAAVHKFACCRCRTLCARTRSKRPTGCGISVWLVWHTFGCHCDATGLKLLPPEDCGAREPCTEKHVATQIILLCAQHRNHAAVLDSAT